jgi:imidazolonepropionase-like amidohydrolase
MVRRYEVLIAVLAACGWPGPGPEIAPATGSFAITDVTLIDGTGAPARSHVTVVVESGRIARIQPAGAPLPANTRAVRGAGRFLIPGLWDMHAHMSRAGDATCAAMIASGVTGVRDPGGALEVVDGLRAHIAGGRLIGPRIFRAGPPVAGTDFVDVQAGTPAATYFALLEQARREGVQVVGQIPLDADPASAIEAGHGSVERVGSLFDGRIALKVEAGKSPERALAEFTDGDAAVLGRQMAVRGTWFDPTLIAYWMRRTAGPLPDTQEVREALASGWRRVREVAAVLRRERVRFLTGTDAGSAIDPGSSLHQELELLVEVGFTPLEVISIASRNAAESLGRLADLGTVEPGKRADLVLLEADPLVDIASTREIAAVVVDGRLHGRAELDAMRARSASLAPAR